MGVLKRLLLGSAAGFVAVTGAQAAEPVEYVKVCSLYGAGFYYMPGTDICIKIGGWVRAEGAWGTNGSMTWGPFNGNVNNRLTSNEAFRARGYITADTRSQTDYGTVRGYIAVGLNTNDVGLQAASLVDSANRAFVQWAGMTSGLSQSFYDFYSVPAAQYRGGYLPASDTGDGGWWVWAYTAQFGNGVSATISSEARRTTQIINQNAIGTAGGGAIDPGSFISAVGGGSALFPGNGAYGGMQSPDVVGNLRVDQAWGGAQVMGALHEVNPTYYSPVTPGWTGPRAEWGWAAGVGAKVNIPFISQGDWFQGQFNVTQGALRYLFNTPNTNWGKVDGAKEAYGVLSDCVYGNVPGGGSASSCMLTSAWGFNASYEHYWTPAWHTSLYGAYYAVSYGKGTGSANAMLCSGAGFGAGFGTGAVAGMGCDNNWQTWGIGSRTQWDVSKTFYLGVEVLYQNLHSAMTGSPAGGLGGYTIGAATVNEANSNNVMVSVRAHRDFLP
jgi:hypothetical protein